MLDPQTQELVDYLGGGEPAIYDCDYHADVVILRPHGTDQMILMSRVFAKHVATQLVEQIRRLEERNP